MYLHCDNGDNPGSETFHSEGIGPRVVAAGRSRGPSSFLASSGSLLIRETISRSAEPSGAAAKKVIRSPIRLHDFAPLALHPIPNKLSFIRRLSAVHVRPADLSLAKCNAGPPNETEAGFRDDRDRRTHAGENFHSVDLFHCVAVGRGPRVTWVLGTEGVCLLRFFAQSVDFGFVFGRV